MKSSFSSSSSGSSDSSSSSEENNIDRFIPKISAKHGRQQKMTDIGHRISRLVLRQNQQSNPSLQQLSFHDDGDGNDAFLERTMSLPSSSSKSGALGKPNLRRRNKTGVRGRPKKVDFGLGPSSTPSLPPQTARLMGMANQCYVNKKYGEAITHLLDVIKESPEGPEAYQTLGLIHEELSELDKAISYYIIAAHLGKKDSEGDLWRRLARLTLMLASSQRESTEHPLLLASHPPSDSEDSGSSSTTTMTTTATPNKDNKRIKEAIFYITKLIRLPSGAGQPEFYWTRARLQIEVGQYTRAIEGFYRLLLLYLVHASCNDASSFSSTNHANSSIIPLSSSAIILMRSLLTLSDRLDSSKISNTSFKTSLLGMFKRSFMEFSTYTDSITLKDSSSLIEPLTFYLDLLIKEGKWDEALLFLKEKDYSLILSLIKDEALLPLMEKPSFFQFENKEKFEMLICLPGIVPSSIRIRYFLSLSYLRLPLSFLKSDGEVIESLVQDLSPVDDVDVVVEFATTLFSMGSFSSCVLLCNSLIISKDFSPDIRIIHILSKALTMIPGEENAALCNWKMLMEVDPTLQKEALLAMSDLYRQLNNITKSKELLLMASSYVSIGITQEENKNEEEKDKNERKKTHSEEPITVQEIFKNLYSWDDHASNFLSLPDSIFSTPIALPSLEGSYASSDGKTNRQKRTRRRLFENKQPKMLIERRRPSSIYQQEANQRVFRRVKEIMVNDTSSTASTGGSFIEIKQVRHLLKDLVDALFSNAYWWNKAFQQEFGREDLSMSNGLRIDEWIEVIKYWSVVLLSGNGSNNGVNGNGGGMEKEKDDMVTFLSMIDGGDRNAFSSYSHLLRLILLRILIKTVSYSRLPEVVMHAKAWIRSGLEDGKDFYCSLGIRLMQLQYTTLTKNEPLRRSLQRSVRAVMMEKYDSSLLTYGEAGLCQAMMAMYVGSERWGSAVEIGMYLLDFIRLDHTNAEWKYSLLVLLSLSILQQSSKRTQKDLSSLYIVQGIVLLKESKKYCSDLSLYHYNMGRALHQIGYLRMAIKEYSMVEGELSFLSSYNTYLIRILLGEQQNLTV